MNESTNNRGDCRTAPATPGLVIIFSLLIPTFQLTTEIKVYRIIIGLVLVLVIMKIDPYIHFIQSWYLQGPFKQNYMQGPTKLDKVALLLTDPHWDR